MPYVQTDSSGAIVGLFANLQPGFATEFLPDTDAGVLAFQASLVPPPTITFLEFMALFTAAEQTAIFASNDTATKMFITMAAGSGGLSLANSEVISGVNYLATATTATPPGPGLITTSEAARILAGTAP
jgi:hypothetical protein